MRQRPFLDVWAGVNGFRVVLVKADTYEVLGLFRTFDEAGKAKRAAEELSESVGRRAAA